MDMPSIDEIESSAVWSGDGPDSSTYRYELHHRFPRALERTRGTVMFIMMNPSYASEVQWDNTVRRCAGYAWDWGYQRLLVGNIFAYRTPFPEGGTDKNGKTWPPIREADDPVGPDNDSHLRRMLTQSDLVVCAWGNAGQKGRGDDVRSLIRDAGCRPTALKVNKTGEPSHPLYLAKSLTPKLYK